MIIFTTLYLSCTTSPATTDTNSTPLEIDQFEGVIPTFVAATLIPEPTHVNAIWAGVGLLDFDGDGWLDIFLPNGSNAPDYLYRNMGNGEFVDVATEAGVASTKANGAVAIADFDNDGDPDMLVNTVCSTGTWHDDVHFVDGAGGLMDGGKILYHNQGDGTFVEKEITLPPELLYLLERCTVSMTPADINHDGFVDIIVSNGHDQDIAPPWIFNKNAEASQNYLLFNDRQGNFNHAQTLEGNQTTFAAAVLDINDDNRLDILFAQGGVAIQGFLGQPDGTLKASWNSTHVGRGLWMGLNLADYNRDGLLDIFATNQGLSPYIVGYNNTSAFFPGEHFSDPNQPDTEEYRPLTPYASILLGQADGFSAPVEPMVSGASFLTGDLFAEWNIPDDVSFEQYREWIPVENLERYAWSWGTVAFDANADGWMDIAFTQNNGTAPLDIIASEEQGAGMGAFLLSTDSLTFYDLTQEAGIANTDETGAFLDGRGLATGDLNNDGYPDLVFANRSYTPSLSDPLAQTPGVAKVWLSEPRSGGWLKVTLQGNGHTSPRDALGAKVWIEHEESPRIYGYGMGGETCSSSEHTLSIGLGDWSEVSVRVRFPSGREVLRSNVTANQHIEIVEPE